MSTFKFLAITSAFVLTSIIGCTHSGSMGGKAVPAVSDPDFAKLLEASADQPVLVDFWAPWCGPCVKLGPTVEQVHANYDGRVLVYKMNIDESPGASSRYNIRSIPALLVFRDGEVVDRLVGLQRQSTIESMLDKSLQ